jgi:DNA polymerase-1
MQKRLFLIDGTALAYRSFFAFQGTGRAPLTTAAGHPTAATYGFCMTLRALLEREKPDAIAISFDGPRSDLVRTRLYADYKSTRSKMPDEMKLQLDDIHEATLGFGIPIVGSETHEADDVIGTLAVRGRDAGMDVFIVTGDKDFLQIVGDHVVLWNLRSSTSKPEILDAAAAQAKWGVPTSAMVDLLALMGDTSDNVPGVPKVGEKTAVELLQQFGSLDAILARTAEIKKASIRQSLEENREMALLSKQLVTLQLDVPLQVDVTQLPPPSPDPEKLRPLFQRLEFKNLLGQLASQPKLQAHVEANYEVVRTAEGLRALLDTLQRAARFALAVEAVGASARTSKLVGIGFAFAPGQAAYVPLNAEPPVLPGGRAAVLQALAPVLAATTPQKAAHDGKRVMMALRTADQALRG